MGSGRVLLILRGSAPVLGRTYGVPQAGARLLPVSSALMATAAWQHWSCADHAGAQPSRCTRWCCSRLEG